MWSEVACSPNSGEDQEFEVLRYIASERDRDALLPLDCAVHCTMVD